MVDISGTVTDTDGNVLDGVQVVVVNTTTNSVAATATTDFNGDWSVTVGSDTYHILYSYEANGEEYNTDSYPYIQ